ncbi:MAG TPA: cobalamin biosynthesis protein, partial [Dissulfurispiraceae bacterium]|nr:cobalamin biosynthesis protein [Dissulfurispiraceae bacterium]
MKRTNAADGTAILYITQKGRLVADRLTLLFPDARVLRYKTGIVPDVWKTSGSLIFIMASGIAVRSIAPLLEDKKRDPAVVVLDEAGRHAISLLSGHLGGANELAASIARFLRGTAVITTASDVNDMPSIDLWAADSGLVIENWDSLPRIATQLLDSGSLNVFPENGAAGPLPAAFLPVKNPVEADMVISNRILEQKPNDRRRLILRPVNLVLGIGCNSGTSRDEIESVVRKVLCDKGLSFSSVRTVATLDRKASEPGLVAFAESHGFDIRAFSA